MQKALFKNIVLALAFFACSLPISSPLQAQNPSLLPRADSLFAEKKYMQSLILFDSLQLSGFESPAMLLKMAYVSEATGDYAKSLYSLILYYQHTSDPAVISKINQLAEKYQLQGYDFGIPEVLHSWFFRNSSLLIILLTIILSSLLALMSYRKIKLGKPPRISLVVFLLLSISLYIFSNHPPSSGKAIIRHKGIPLMKGPSPASGIISLNTGAAHLVHIEEKGEAWSKIQFEEYSGYIRTHHLRIIP